MNSSSRADIPSDLATVMGDRELDPEAHISPEVLAMLSTFIWVGIPRDWMMDIMTDGDGLKPEHLPTEFLENQMLLGGNFKTLKKALDIMTELVNTGNNQLPRDRKEYQENELNIMRIVIDSVKHMLNDPATTKLILALRGAKFFEELLTEYASSTLEVEAKRIMLKRKDDELGSPFVVGLAPIEDIDEAEIENVKTLLLPDDCLSTGMTQMAVLEQLLMKGYRPENVVMVFTVGTLAGINYIYDKFEDLVGVYELDAELVLQCGGLCYKVNDKMYLQTPDGLFMVGDMGDWNEPIYKPEDGEAINHFLDLEEMEGAGEWETEAIRMIIRFVIKGDTTPVLNEIVSLKLVRAIRIFERLVREKDSKFTEIMDKLVELDGSLLVVINSLKDDFPDVQSLRDGFNEVPIEEEL